ncbi:MAG: acyltransferase [Chthoniobacteraceae bacterium]
MFGSFRLLLACLVALSHFGVSPGGFNLGQWSVISFYILSGYVMERQYRKIADVRLFYVDRFLRIYPLFAVVLVIGCFITRPGLYTILANALIVPLDYDVFTKATIVLGPTWSLGAEVQFYLLVPWLFGLSVRWLRGLVTASILLFAISPFLPQNAFWAYTAFPSSLFAFVSGMMIARRDVAALKGFWFAFLGLFPLFIYPKLTHGTLPTGININVCIGYLIALPSVWKLAQFSPKNKVDEFLGLLCYPMFLVHYLFVLTIFNDHPACSKLLLIAYSLGASLLLTLVIERPLDRYRHQVRKLFSAGRKDVEMRTTSTAS